MDSEGGTRGPAPESAVISALSGDLPCLRCRYNLRGLSVLGVCPECGTPVRATLLSVVDPHASELRPIARVRLVAWGMVLWSASALAAALAAWAIRTVDVVELLGNAALDTRWLAIFVCACVVLSGIGAAVLVHPHSGIARWRSAAAVLGVVAYAPLAWVCWKIHVVIDPIAVDPFVQTEYVNVERVILRLAAAGLLLVVLLGLRPNARVLAARSLLLREGRVDRQTMLAMAAVVVLGATGDGLHLLSRSLTGMGATSALVGGTLLIVGSSLLFTIGLFGVLVDVWRIRGVILDPAPTLEQLLDQSRERRAAGGAVR